MADSYTRDITDFFCFHSENNDVYLGWVGWSAGGFDQKYELVETPFVNGTSLTDGPIMAQCVAGQFTGKGRKVARKLKVRRK